MGREIKREPSRGEERQNYTGHANRQRPAHFLTTARLRETKEKELIDIFAEWNRQIKHQDQDIKSKQVLFLVLKEDIIALRFSLFCECVPKGASSAAVLAGAVEMKDRRAHKATVPACAPGAHWERAGQKE